ncbi:MAG: hypothetical protein HZA67_11980 [Rhodospirillales bacterium]|nr:hypothetical protein [Rhodospirillales bacterium]
MAGSQIGSGSGNIASILIGVAAGAYIGNKLGGMLDCNDQKAAAETNQKSAETNERIYWSSQGAEDKAKAAQTEQDKILQAKQAAFDAELAKEREARIAAEKALANEKAKKAPAPVKSEVKAKPAPTVAAVSATEAKAQTAWQVREPVKSQGASGMWGWSEPVGQVRQAANGRTCRTLRQVVVDAQGRQTEQQVESCRDPEKGWVVVQG